MDLQELRRHWDGFGATDPMWAVLSNPGKRNRRWDADEFFASGREEIRRVLDKIDAALTPSGRTLTRGRVLDFGAGVGRASQALSGHFAQCDGVDIARSMVAEAQGYNTFPDSCRYHLNERDDLGLFDDATFDLVYTAHVLQHMEPVYAERYVTEFFRVLKPGGVAMFEMVTEPVVGATAPLPDEAFQASITIVDAPARLAPGERALVTADVRNGSPCTWPAAGKDGWYLVTLGNHWVDADGVRVVDDGRATLWSDVGPRASCRMEVVVTAPATPGPHTLELDLVQEGAAWFGDRGSAVASVPVEVAGAGRPTAEEPTAEGLTARRAWLRLPWRRAETPVPAVPVAPAAPAPAADASSEAEPRMEMHGTPEVRVREWVAAAGGEVIGIFDWTDISDSPSYDWHRRGFIAVR